MKRIAIISENISYPPDEGFKKASVAIAVSLAGLGKDITVFAPDAPELPVPAHKLPRNKLLIGSAFSHNLKASKPDVVLYIPQAAATSMSLVRARHLHRQSGGSPVAMLSLQRRTHSPLVRPLLKSFCPDLVLVLSSGSADIMRASGLKAKRVPLGVDTHIFRPPASGEQEALRSKYGIGRGKVILHVGHLSAGRNLGLLRRISADGWKVVVVSSTSTAHHADVASELREASAVIIDTYLENVDEVYRLADAYVFPTFAEKGAIEIPLSVLEAMATNLPVVTTDFGGIPDLFSEGQGLYICSSEAELIDKARDVLSLEDVATRDLALRFSWEEVAKTIAQTIESEIA